MKALEQSKMRKQLVWFLKSLLYIIAYTITATLFNSIIAIALMISLHVGFKIAANIENK